MNGCYEPRRQKGSALVVVMLILLLSSILGLALLTNTLNSHRSVLASEHSTRAKYIAEFGAYVGLEHLQKELESLGKGQKLSCDEIDFRVRRLANEFEGGGEPGNDEGEKYDYALAISEKSLQDAKILCENNSPFGLVLGYQYVVEGTLIVNGHVEKDGSVPGKATFEIPVQISNMAEVFNYALASKHNIWLNGSPLIQGDVYAGEALAVHPVVHYPLLPEMPETLETLLDLDGLLGLDRLLDNLLGGLSILLDLPELLAYLLDLPSVLDDLLGDLYDKQNVYPKIEGRIITAPKNDAHNLYHIKDEGELLYTVGDLVENLTEVLRNLLTNVILVGDIFDELKDILFGGNVEAGMHKLKARYKTDLKKIQENHYLIGNYQFEKDQEVAFPKVNMEKIKKIVAKKAGFDLDDLKEEYDEHGPHIREKDTKNGITYHYITKLRERCILFLFCTTEETQDEYTINAHHNPDSNQKHIYYINGDLVLEGDDLNLGAVFYVTGDVELRRISKSTNAVAGTIIANGNIRIVHVDKPVNLNAFLWQNGEEGIISLYGVYSPFTVYGGLIADNIVLNGARYRPTDLEHFHLGKNYLNYDPKEDDYFYKKGKYKGQRAAPLLTIHYDDQFVTNPPAGVPTTKAFTLSQIGAWEYGEEGE